MTEERATEIMTKTRELLDAKGDKKHFDRLLEMLRDEKVSYHDIFYEAEGGALRKVCFNDEYLDCGIRREMRDAARDAMIKVVEKMANVHVKIVESLQAEYNKL